MTYRGGMLPRGMRKKMVVHTHTTQSTTMDKVYEQQFKRSRVDAGPGGEEKEKGEKIMLAVLRDFKKVGSKNAGTNIPGGNAPQNWNPGGKTPVITVLHIYALILPQIVPKYRNQHRRKKKRFCSVSFLFSLFRARNEQTCVRACPRQIPALISEMESRGICPDVELYNWAIKAASAPRAGRAMRAILTREGGWRTPGQPSSGGGRKTESPSLGWEAATGLLRDMSSKGVAPSSITYTLVISACQKDREPERALAVLREMQELAAAATSSETPASPKSEDSAEGDPEQAATDGAAAAAAAVEEGAGGSGGAGLDDSGAGAGGSAGGSGGGVGASPSRRRRRRAVAPNVFHYSTVMSAFTERPGGWKRILALIKEMEVMNVFFLSVCWDRSVPVVQCARFIVWLLARTWSVA